MAELLWSKEFRQSNDHYPENFGELGGWNPENKEVLRDFLRALRRKKGFGLFFVQCNNPAQGERVMASIRKQIPQKRLQQFNLNRESESLYGEIQERYKLEPFEVACITGVEQVLLGYEDTKRIAGWTSQEIYNYSWKGVPPLLSHLNLQREAFESSLPVALVFLVRGFVIDYFIQRAPDFFDWRSGFFKFTESAEDLQKLSQELVDGDYQEYRSLTPERRMEKILEIKDKILQFDPADGEQKSSLLREQGQLFQSGGESIQALDCYCRSLIANPQNYKAWISKGILLYKLERYEEAVESFDKHLEVNPDAHDSWMRKGLALHQLGKLQEACACFSKVSELQPSDEYSFNDQGYLNLAGYSYGLQPILGKPLLIRQHQHCSDSPAKIDIDLERCQKSLALFETALQLNPEFTIACANHSFPAYYLQQYQTALQSCDRALELDPNNQEEMNEVIYTNRGYILLQLQNPTAALQDFTSALSLAPHLDEAWIGKGTALYQLGRYSEAHDSFSQALALKHPLAQGNLDVVQQLLETNS